MADVTVKVPGKQGADGDFPVVDLAEIEGAKWSVANAAALSTIPAKVRKIGMEVELQDTGDVVKITNVTTMAYEDTAETTARKAEVARVNLINSNLGIGYDDSTDDMPFVGVVTDDEDLEEGYPWLGFDHQFRTTVHYLKFLPLADDTEDDMPARWAILTKDGYGLLWLDHNDRLHFERSDERTFDAGDDDYPFDYFRAVTNPERTHGATWYNRPDNTFGAALDDWTVTNISGRIAAPAATTISESLLPGNVFGAQSYNANLIRVFSDTSGKTLAYLGKRTNAPVYVEEGREPIEMVIRYGDSTVQGSGDSDEDGTGDTPDITSSVTPNTGLQLDVGLRGTGDDEFVPSSVQDFAPAVETVDGKLTSTGMCAFMRNANLRQTTGIRRVYLATVEGRSGLRMDELQQGSVYYDNMIARAVKAKEIAATYGRGLKQRYVMLSDGTNDRSAGRTEAQFITDATTFLSDYDTDIKAALGTTDDVVMMMEQTTAPKGNASTFIAGVQATAQLKISLDDTNKAYLAVNPNFLLKADEVHFKPLSTAIKLEYKEKAYHRYETYGHTVHCPQPDLDNISVSGTTITIPVQCVQVPGTDDEWYGIEFSTTLVIAATNQGFLLEDASATISSVMITDDGSTTGEATIEVEVSTTLTAGAAISYGYDGTASAPQNWSCAWGNVFDTDPEPSKSDPGRELNNQMAAFRKVIA